MFAYFDPTSVSAISSAVYGLATLFLVFQIWRDRVQRERHFEVDMKAKALAELRTAFYEAWGFWTGHQWVVGSADLDAAQVGRQFEALARLECQLRLNGHNAEANDLGFAVRTELSKIQPQLDKAGLALGLIPKEYRQFSAGGFAAPAKTTG